MSVTTPAVSVIIAALNEEETIGDQLDALSRQQPPFAWEVLICDNGSTDRTADVVRVWQERFPELRLVDASSRRGAGAARNIGAAAAASGILAFCDADDVVGEDWLVRLHSAIQKTALVVGAGETAVLNPPGHVTVSWSVDDLIIKPYWPRFPAGASSNLAIRTELFREVGGFDESLVTAEDVDLCWRVQIAGEALERHEDVIVHIRKRVGFRAIYRQAKSYAIGDQQLQAKYAEHIRADQVAEFRRERGSQLGAPSAVGSFMTGTVERILRTIGPSGLANAAWRAGSWHGSRRRHLSRRSAR